MSSNNNSNEEGRSPVLQVSALGFPWQTIDPFLFCVYHDDAYPKANAQMGPEAALADRQIGQDFSRKDGWSCLLYTSPSPRDLSTSRMPSSA